MSSVLSARGITVSFGGVHAVVDVDLDVEPGQLVGLIGPNGAGKTTFIDAVTGFVQHGGTVLPGRGSRLSFSTTCRCARTSPSQPINPPR